MLPLLGGKLVAWLAETALMKSPFGSFIKALGQLLAKVPSWVWIILGSGIALWCAWNWHDHAVKQTYDSGYAQAKKDDAASLKALQVKVKAATVMMVQTAQTIRSNNDAIARNIHTIAAAQRVRGPGRASLREQLGNPAVPAATGGHEPANRTSDAAGPQLPPADGNDDRAVVSWSWLTGRAEQCDLWRNEDLSWRDWWTRENAIVEQLRKAGPDSAFHPTNQPGGTDGVDGKSTN